MCGLVKLGRIASEPVPNCHSVAASSDGRGRNIDPVYKRVQTKSVLIYKNISIFDDFYDSKRKHQPATQEVAGSNPVGEQIVRYLYHKNI